MPASWLKPARLPFFYGWVVVAVVFVSMALGVNARTAFSLLMPPLLDEFGWDRGVTAGAFAFGFLVSALASPTLGWVMDRFGPRVVMELGIVMMAAGLLAAPLTQEPWHIYVTLGVLVGGGSVCLGYTGQSLFLPNWFVRRRALAISLAFSGVGVGSIVMLPWLQGVVEGAGWRDACTTLGIVVLVLLAPINLLLRRRPQDLGLEPDGEGLDAPPRSGRTVRVIDPAWAAVDWTLARAARTARFWWIAIGNFCALFAWYAVQVHQTKYLLDTGFGATEAAWALGLVSLVAIPGQIALGALADRIGREWVWTIGNLGFAICYAALLALAEWPSPALLYVMVISQGLLGYGLTSVLGAITAEIFQGRHYGVIFGTLMMMSMAGGALGPWATGALYDLTGSYALPFAIALALTAVSAVAIWLAGPRKVRAVVLA